MFEFISPEEAQIRMEAEEVALVDIRDPESHAAARIPSSIHLNDRSVQQFLGNADREKALIVYCYHGNSSQMAARFFVEQGFSQVYSMSGGFEAWRVKFPDLCQSAQDAAESD